MPEIEIRPAVSADIAHLVALDHHYTTHFVWQMDRAFDEGQVSTTFREIRLPRAVRVEYPRPARELLESWKDASELLLASLAGEPVGYLYLTEQLSPATAWVRDLVVTEKLRRKGIAAALLLTAQDWATRNKYRRMIVEMQSKNYPAIKLALKLGYEFCGYHDQYFVNQDIALFFARYLR